MTALGNGPVVRDTPETRRISVHLRNLHPLIAETKAEYLAMKRNILSTPDDMVTPGQKGELQRLENEVIRLQNGYSYWQQKLETTRRRAGLPAAPISPRAAISSGSSWNWQTPAPWPKGGGGVVGPVPMPADVPPPPRMGTFQTEREEERVCGIPPGLSAKMRERWIKDRVIDAWSTYLRNRSRAENYYFDRIQKWHVDLYYWNLRRQKAEAAGRTFTERQPRRPSYAAPRPPRCRPAHPSI